VSARLYYRPVLPLLQLLLVANSKTLKRRCHGNRIFDTTPEWQQAGGRKTSGMGEGAERSHILTLVAI